MSLLEELAVRAENIVRKHGIYKPPVPVEEIVRKEGISLLVINLDPDMSGTLMRSGPDDLVVIAVNESHHRNRRRFTIAHELGHFYLGHLAHHPHIDRQFTAINRDELSSQATDSREIEANTFAANLLMPADFLIKDFVKLGGVDQADLSRLALRYQVSEQALTYRLQGLGLLPPY
jgi:Zn-dependent peptidase ImmA (M78 family)